MVSGSLAGLDAVYDGVFAQSGVVRARSMEELFDFCWCFGICPLPAGKRILVQTHSGGPGAVAADACARTVLTLPPIDDQAGKLAERMKGSDKTFIGFSYNTGEKRFVRAMYEHGAPVLPGPNRAARALGAMARYVDLRKKILSQI